MKDEVYYFHQTPAELCKKLIAEIAFEDGDKVLEPFRGEGAFYNAFPDNIIKDWCEIEEGKDYKDYTEIVDWVVSNPPFRLETGKKRVNSFYLLIDYYSTRVNKGICFLANDSCFSTLTPKRLKDLNSKGLYLSKIVVSNIKKWRGRYFFLIFTKIPNNYYKFIEGNH